MKLVYSLLFATFLTVASQAQPDINLSIFVQGLGNFDLPDGETQTSFIPIYEGQSGTFTFTVSNTGDADLILSTTGGVYIAVSGSAATEVTVDESNLTANPTIPAGGSQTFTVTNSPTTPAGDYSLTMTLASNDPDAESIYSGTVEFTISPATAVIAAKEIGMTLAPSPSTDGQITIKANNVAVNKVIVYNTAGGKEEFNESLSFHTKQKGLLIVHVYTDKGIAVEKIIVQ